MKLVIRFDLDNAAFRDEHGLILEDEVAHYIREVVAGKVITAINFPYEKMISLYDVNGNKIGCTYIELDEET
jgi:hypothetical protein